ncbi:uncharacterized protein EDB93DRAFT_1116218, partial [Suillus bovinus]|uniref:uncharacterized protein n=1 Tax=Suillus bovinus TaxID=48563 RepID=UPI001B87D0F2
MMNLNFLPIFLLAFTAVSPLGARAMPETTDGLCTWERCGIKCLGRRIVNAGPCIIGGRPNTQSVLLQYHIKVIASPMRGMKTRSAQKCLSCLRLFWQVQEQKNKIY